MNKIYSLKYSVITRGYIAVSELARKCTCKCPQKKNLVTLIFLSSLGFSGSTCGSIVSAEIDYQFFRDFAENKGVFKPGVTNIAIPYKNGELAGYLNKAPMPDFSSVNVRNAAGVATLVHPQYIASVRHNGGYQSVQFGNTYNNPDNNHFSYSLVDRNNSSIDFHLPRLNKLVTESIPSEINGATQAETLNAERFPVFYRLGSGTQYIQDKDGNRKLLSGAYSYLTGGTVPVPLRTHGGTTGYQLYMGGNINNHGLMASFGQAGDSGSPLFGWDALHNKWVLVAVYSAIGNGTNPIWKIPPATFVQQTMHEDSDPAVTYDSSYANALEWTFDAASGTGTLIQGDHRFNMHGQNGTDLNAGKNLTFSGQNGLIDLKNNVSQGAGSLTFMDSYTVSSSSGSIWTGAGISIEENATVKWQINGKDGDALHKIGAGTLHVNATGTNPGNMRVGDGTVILDQQSDANGNKQAFNTVTLTSGRPTVVLSDAYQVNPDNIYFGYRGGRLDVNGNDLSFSRIKNADSGAHIVNNNASHGATLTVTGRGINNNNDNQTFQGFLGEKDKERHNGELNFSYVPDRGIGILNLSGGANLNGTLSVQNGGMLMLSGNPVQHAGNVFIEGDWNNAQFNVKNVNVGTGSSLQVSEYASLTGDINAESGTSVTLGYVIDDTQRCMLNQNTGVTSCSAMAKENVPLSGKATVSVNGNVKLNENARMNIGNAVFTGAITGSTGTALTMSNSAVWNVNNNSSVHYFNSRGGTLSFINEVDKWVPKLVTVESMTASNMNIKMGVSTSDSTSDRLDISGQAKGGHNILDLTSIFDQTIHLRDDVTVASAPSGTSHGYFSFATLSRGFTVYSPETQVVEKDGKVLWQLKNSITLDSDVAEVPGQNQPPSINSNGSPSTDGNANQNTNSGDIPNIEQKPATDPNVNSSAGETAGSNNNNIPESNATQIKGESLFTGSDNKDLLKQARDMFSSREFIVSDNINRWQKVIDSSGSESGLWAMSGFSQGGYDAFTLNQSGLDVGFSKREYQAYWGAAVDLYKGYSRAPSYRDDYKLWGVTVFFGENYTSGGFWDASVGYKQLNENFSIKGELNDLSGTAKSHIATLGGRGGYRWYSEMLDTTFIPSLSLNAVKLNGNKIKGKERFADLHSGDAVWIETGVLAEKSFDVFKVNASIHRNFTLNDMPGITLGDSWKERHYQAKNSERYTASVGLEGELSEDLKVQLKFNNSFGGHFKTDSEGIFGIKYNF